MAVLHFYVLEKCYLNPIFYLKPEIKACWPRREVCEAYSRSRSMFSPTSSIPPRQTAPPEPSSPSASSSSVTTVSLFFQHWDAQERAGAELYFTHFTLKYFRNNLIRIALEEPRFARQRTLRAVGCAQVRTALCTNSHMAPPCLLLQQLPIQPRHSSETHWKCCSVNPTGPH